MKEDLSDIINTIPQMIWKISVKDDIIHPIYSNKAWETYIGKKNISIFDENIVHPDDFFVSKNAWDFAQKKHFLQINRRLKNVNGEYNWFLTRAIYKDGFWYGTCTDINELRKNDNEYEKNNRYNIQKLINEKIKTELERINASKEDIELLTNQKINDDENTIFELSIQADILSKENKEAEIKRINLSKKAKILAQEKIEAEIKRINLSKEAEKLAQEKKEAEIKRINLSKEAEILANEKIKSEEIRINTFKKAEILANEKIKAKEAEILAIEKVHAEKIRINLVKESEILANEKIKAEEKRFNLLLQAEKLANEKVKAEEIRIDLLLQAEKLSIEKIKAEELRIDLLSQAEILSKEKIEYENKKLINKIIKESLINKNLYLENNNLELVKLKEKDEEFLSFISHEIRNPIYAISSMVNFLKDTSLTVDQLDFVNIQEESCNIILHLVKNILNDKKIKYDKVDLENETINLVSLIQNVVNISKNQIDKKSLQLIVNIPIIEYEVFGDYYKITQILLNLINNATKFTSKGSITVSCNIFDENDSTYNVTISVTDTGIGVYADKMNKLFKPFSQTDESIQEIYGGYGLGLNICQKLITLMNGTIGVESTFGKGSKFFINLLMVKNKSL